MVHLDDDPETPEKVLVGPSEDERQEKGPEAAEGEVQVVPLVFAQAEETRLGHQAKRFRPTLGSTSTSFLEGLSNVDPCTDIPMERVPAEVREIMARYTRPSFLGEDPSAHARSVVGLAATRENIIRGIPQF